MVLVVVIFQRTMQIGDVQGEYSAPLPNATERSTIVSEKDSSTSPAGRQFHIFH